MDKHKVVSQAEWEAARKAFLIQEKAFTKQRDELSAARRALPWVRVEKNYVFDSHTGPVTLADLFAGRSQLAVYHFMFGPDWEAGCKSCSFWADNFNGIVTHLKHRDVTLIAISRAPEAKLEAFKRRMGWSFNWVSSFSNEFNMDFGVSFTPQEMASGKVHYNYAECPPFSSEGPGISIFYKDADGAIYHTYSTYGRGLDMMNGAYHWLDLLPKGRDEGGLSSPQAWVRHHDKYE